jgi:hypothetical protein
MHKLDQFTRSYMETALWAETDDTGRPLDDQFSIDDFSDMTVARMVADCRSFQKSNFKLISRDLSRAGHDFWLTRNGHGAGFWDGDWGKVGDKLTKAAKKFGEFNLYVGDDGQIHYA